MSWKLVMGVCTMRRALTAALLTTLLAAMAGTGSASAQPAERAGTLTVNGQGRVDVPPDHTRVTVAVVTQAASPEAAAAAHRDRASRATTRLRDMKNDGVSIEQSSFGLSELRRPERPNEPARSEFQAATTYE